jgi:fructose-bisphosphate aldolase class II
MSLVTNKELFERARAGGYAVPAFNTNNLEYVQAVVQAAVELRSPVIISAVKVEVDYMGGPVFVAMVKAMVDRLPIPVSIHLDHGPSLEEVVRCLRYGFTSVMYDGSGLSLAENIASTRRVVEVAHACGVPVEGETGVIGLAGQGPEAARSDRVGLTDPDECEQYVKESGLDSFAAVIGNVHGLVSGQAVLRFDLLEEIRRRIEVPLVLHGGTGVPEGSVRRAIGLGVTKVNIGTAMRKGFVDTLAQTMSAHPGEFDLLKLLSPSRQRMVEIAKQKMKMCMSDGKA